MAFSPVLVQHTGDDSTTEVSGSPTNWSMTFPQATTAGNMLFAALRISGGAGAPAPTGPSGWSLLKTVNDGSVFSYALFAYPNAPAISTAQAFSWALGYAGYGDGCLMEFSGCGTSMPVIDGTVTTAALTTPNTSISSAATSGAGGSNDLVFALGGTNGIGVSGVTAPGFTPVQVFFGTWALAGWVMWLSQSPAAIVPATTFTFGGGTSTDSGQAIFAVSVNPPSGGGGGGGTGLPAGMSLSTSGVFSGTPSVVADTPVTFEVTDSTGATAEVTLPFDVVANLVSPTITTSSLPAGSQGTSYGPVTVQATGGTTPYTWSMSGAPAGLTIASGTGVISGTPSTSGTFTVVITCVGANNSSTQASLSLTVSGTSTGYSAMSNPTFSGSLFSSGTPYLDVNFSQPLLTYWSYGFTSIVGVQNTWAGPGAGTPPYVGSSDGGGGGAYANGTAYYCDYDLPGNVYQTSQGPTPSILNTYNPQPFSSSGWGLGLYATYIGPNGAYINTNNAYQTPFTAYWYSGAVNSSGKIDMPPSGYTKFCVQLKAKCAGLAQGGSVNGAATAFWFLGNGTEIDWQETGAAEGSNPNYVSTGTQQTNPQHPNYQYNSGQDLTQAYHIYQMQYDGTNYMFALDNNKYWTWNFPGQGQMFLIMNVSIYNPYNSDNGWYTTWTSTEDMHADIMEAQFYVA